MLLRDKRALVHVLNVVLMGTLISGISSFPLPGSGQDLSLVHEDSLEDPRNRFFSDEAMTPISGSSGSVEFCAGSCGTTSITVSLSYPTNEINQPWDIFSFDADIDIYAGYDESWQLAESALVLTGATETSWTDIGQNGRGSVTTVTHRFYAAASSTIDDDSDGLSTGTELFLLGTDPDEVDTDGDGLIDGVGGVVPTATYPGGVDRDGDGFVDGEEDAGSDPTQSDSDGDTTHDGVEWAIGTDPSNSDTHAPRVRIVSPGNLQSLFLIP